MNTSRYTTANGATTQAWSNIKTGINLTPEFAYSVSTALDSLNASNLVSLTETGQMAVGMGWNYLDGVCLLYSGVNLMLDDTSYQQTQNRIKGSIMLVSSAAQLLFTYQEFIKTALITATSLAGPVFTFSTMMDWIIGMIDLYDAANKADFDCWLDETLAEIHFIDEKLKTNTPAAQKFVFAKKREELLYQVDVRCKVHCHDAVDNSQKQERAEKIDNVLLSAFKTSKSANTQHMLKGIQASFRQKPTYVEINKDRKIQQALNQNLKKCQKEFFIKTLSMIGMTLLAISTFTCPPVFIAGMIMTGIVASYYLGKQGYAVGKYIASTETAKNCARFFNAKKNDVTNNSVNQNQLRFAA